VARGHTGNVYAETAKLLDALRHQDESHAHLLALPRAFINMAAVASRLQRDRTHQTGNAGTKNGYVHEQSYQRKVAFTL